MKKILVVDNQDSFVYNLVEMLRVIDIPFTIVKQHEIHFPLCTTSIAGVLLSPGGGLPSDYPQMMELIRQYHHQLPILGVCLGHQAIAECFGATLRQLPSPLHGHASQLHILDSTDELIQSVTPHSTIGRYHSWVVSSSKPDTSLQCVATDEDNNVMILRHSNYPIWGVQFHPESVITDSCGPTIVSNWIKQCSF